LGNNHEYCEPVVFKKYLKKVKNLIEVLGKAEKEKVSEKNAGWFSTSSLPRCEKQTRIFVVSKKKSVRGFVISHM